jgi:hypothetical protein
MLPSCSVTKQACANVALGKEQQDSHHIDRPHSIYYILHYLAGFFKDDNRPPVTHRLALVSHIARLYGGEKK